MSGRKVIFLVFALPTFTFFGFIFSPHGVTTNSEDVQVLPNAVMLPEL
jgi:hypothetical protein